MRAKYLAGPLLAALILACGGDGGTGPSPSYESIAGTYVGPLAATSQGLLLQVNVSLVVTQSQGNLGGSYSLTGTLSDGLNTIDVAGGGSLAGSIASGSNPSVNVTATNGTCPNVQTTLSGAYDSANRAITFPNVTLPLFNNQCQENLVFTNIILVIRR